jgi:integrase
MATIVPVVAADGSKKFKALVRIKRAGKIVFSQARTFERRAVAKNWAKGLEVQLQDPAKLEQVANGDGPTFGQLIARYIREINLIKPLGRTHQGTLEMLLAWPIAGKIAAKLQPGDWVEHCTERRAKGTGPATVMQDVVLARGPLGIAKVKWNLHAVSTASIDEAMPLLTRLNLVARPQRRQRRLRGDEGKRLLEFFREQDERSEIPMAEIFEYALWTTRREGEITRLRWTDLDDDKKTQMLRDMKDPRKKEGNDFTYPLLGDAYTIAKRQPVTDERIFPYESRSVSARMTRACKKLGIIDLTFHDLRHEAISRLFEAGYLIHEVAQVTGHKDINTLWKIYTHLYPEAVHGAPQRRAQLKLVA